jgi:2-polyprenyl-3-methyl-5-hydroxy-6-metoxy-1,4-benzoquinol methylase
MIRLARQDIRRLVEQTRAELSSHDTDDMAVPTWLHWNPLIRWLFWRRLAVIETLADLGSEDAVLDFGCGVGLLLPTLAARAGTVYATDLRMHYARTLNEQHGLGVRFIDELGDLPDGTLDVIVAADVMEHLEDPDEWARRFARKLKPDGRLIISGPSENALYRLGRWVAGFGGKGEYHHTNIAGLAGTIESVGYRTLRRRRLPFGWLPMLFEIIEFGRPPSPEEARHG